MGSSDFRNMFVLIIDIYYAHEQFMIERKRSSKGHPIYVLHLQPEMLIDIETRLPLLSIFLTCAYIS